MTTEWDYIVVGAGSAGCVIASRLSEDPHMRVLLIEAGRSDLSPFILAPGATNLYVIGRQGWDWRYMAEPDPSRGGRADLWPRGKLLGGSSSINGTIYIRGHAQDFDNWASSGAEGWSYKDVLPYFRRAETNDLGPSEFHGDAGPLSVQSPRYVHPVTHRFVEAAVEAGLPFNPDVNGIDQEGVGYNQSTQRRGRRHNTARAYLGPVSHRKNLKVLTHAQVTRVLFREKHAYGVEFRERGRMKVATASREIVLSAGAIGSPQLLMLSGIGPAEDLKAHGIEVISDRPGVGENLQEHPGTWMTYQVSVPTLNNETSLPKQALHGLNWLAFGRGPATTAGSQAVAFFRTDDREVQPDIQLHFTPVGYTFTESEVLFSHEQMISIVPNICRPKSRGRVSLRSANPDDPPKIEIALLSDAGDVQRLIRACRKIRHIMTQRAVASIVQSEIGPGPDVNTDEEWDAYIRERTVPIFHPVGTCRMGRSNLSVTDPRLRVYGVTGLRVADASVMPVITSGNTNAPAIMIGEKASDLIREGA